MMSMLARRGLLAVLFAATLHACGGCGSKTQTTGCTSDQDCVDQHSGDNRWYCDTKIDPHQCTKALRECESTVAPARCSTSTVTAPMPRDPPVTRMVLPVRSITGTMLPSPQADHARRVTPRAIRAGDSVAAIAPATIAIATISQRLVENDPVRSRTPPSPSGAAAAAE